MTIETVIEWAKANPAPAGFIASMFTLAAWVVACAFWRWVARRRKDKELGIVRRKGFVFLCGSKPDFAPPVYSWTPLDEPEPKPAPDLKYQGDQVTGMRKELLALEERLVTRAEWDKGHQNLDEWVDLLASGLHTAKADLVRLEERVERLEKPPQPARYRVFRDGNVFCAACADGIEVAWRGRSGIWRVPVSPWVAGQFERSNSHAELPGDSPEYREIVASFEAWRKGQ